VLVRCPGCSNLHLFADRLGYFEDEPIDAEVLLKRKGEHVRKIGFGELSGMSSGPISTESGESKHSSVSNEPSDATESSVPTGSQSLVPTASEFSSSSTAARPPSDDEHDATGAVRQAIEDGVFELSPQDIALLRGNVDGYAAKAEEPVGHNNAAPGSSGR